MKTIIFKIILLLVLIALSSCTLQKQEKADNKQNNNNTTQNYTWKIIWENEKEIQEVLKVVDDLLK